MQLGGHLDSFSGPEVVLSRLKRMIDCFRDRTSEISKKTSTFFFFRFPVHLQIHNKKWKIVPFPYFMQFPALLRSSWSWFPEHTVLLWYNRLLCIACRSFWDWRETVTVPTVPCFKIILCVGLSETNLKLYVPGTNTTFILGSEQRNIGTVNWFRCDSCYDLILPAFGLRHLKSMAFKSKKRLRNSLFCA